MRSHLDAEIARGAETGAASVVDDDDDDICAVEVVLLEAGVTVAGTCNRDRLRKAGTSCCAAGERDDAGVDEAARLERGVAEAEKDAGNCSETEAAVVADAVGVLAKNAPPPGDGVSGAKKSCRRAG
jgi:hypothetical protein